MLHPLIFHPSIFWVRVLGTRADPSWLWEAEVHHRAISIHTHWSVWKVFISVPLIYAPPFLWIWPEQIRTFHPACSNPALHPSFKTYCRWMFCRVGGCDPVYIGFHCFEEAQRCSLLRYFVLGWDQFSDLARYFSASSQSSSRRWRKQLEQQTVRLQTAQ